MPETIKLTSYRYTGAGHPFYQYGESYTLRIRRWPTFSRVLIWVERGKGSTINASQKRYKNWAAFQEDWASPHHPKERTNRMRLNIEPGKIDIYPVGFLRDYKLWREGRSLKQTWYWFKRSWRRRTYWNGYLAESSNKARCGTGWTKASALRSWKRIPEL